MELDRRKTGILIVAVAALAGVVLLCVALFAPHEEEQEEIRNVYIDHPDAEVPAMADSKMASYRTGRRSVEEYWDSIEETEGAEDADPLAEITSDARSSGPSGSVRQALERKEGGFIQVAPETEGTGAKTSSSGSGYKPMTSEERMAMYDEMSRRRMEDAVTLAMQMQQGQQKAAVQDSMDDMTAEQKEPEEPEPVRIEAEKATVRRSGGVSSLDDGFDGMSGISSLDGTDEELGIDSARPFKCMFVKEEKIETGQRVSVRLMEDMVVSGTLVPKNTHLMAVCTVGSRLELKVTSIEMNGRIYSLDYEAYDVDGTKGIYCPDVDTKTQDEARRGGLNLSRRSVTRMGAIASELANVGFAIAEGVGSSGKKTVKVPGGYMFYLVDASLR